VCWLLQDSRSPCGGLAVPCQITRDDDDQVDSTSQALEWLKQRVPGWGLLEFYRLMAEHSNLQPTKTLIRLKAPAGITHFYPRNRAPILIGPDGIFEVSDEDARPLYADGFVKLD
jgi:hypothetical protein